MLVSFLIIASIFVFATVASILISRKEYQKKIMRLKLESQAKRLKVNESYWYNSAKGSLVSVYPSCWAKVIGPPYVFNNRIITVPVVLKTPTGNIEADVPTESLTEIVQLNS